MNEAVVKDVTDKIEVIEITYLGEVEETKKKKPVAKKKTVDKKKTVAKKDEVADVVAQAEDKKMEYISYERGLPCVITETNDIVSVIVNGIHFEPYVWSEEISDYVNCSGNIKPYRLYDESVKLSARMD